MFYSQVDKRNEEGSTQHVRRVSFPCRGNDLIEARGKPVQAFGSQRFFLDFVTMSTTFIFLQRAAWHLQRDLFFLIQPFRRVKQDETFARIDSTRRLRNLIFPKPKRLSKLCGPCKLYSNAPSPPGCTSSSCPVTRTSPLP